LSGYENKLGEALKKKEKLEEYISELNWHIRQLKEVEDFQSCPGSLCRSCEYRKHCQLAISDK
jgi:hypothetical protein